MRPTSLPSRSSLPTALLWLSVGGIILGALLMGCPSPDTVTDGDGGSLGVEPDPSPYRQSFDETWAQLDEDVQAIAAPVEEGELAGTFALYSVSATEVDTVVMGKRRGGGVNYGLVTRSFDEESRQYTQTTELCGGFNFEVADVVTGVAPGTYRLVPPSTAEVVRADAETGVYLGDGHVQLWAIRDLPDPIETPLPATIEEADMPPHKDRIYDLEDDGKPGLTLFVQVADDDSGEIYAIQRKIVLFTGVSTGPDGVVGFTDTAYDNLLLGAEPDVLELVYQGSATKHPDPNESWFEETRIDDASDCDDVLSMADDGDLGREQAPWLE